MVLGLFRIIGFIETTFDTEASILAPIIMQAITNQQHHYLHFEDTLGMVDNTGVTKHVHSICFQKSFFIQLSFSNVPYHTSFNPVLSIFRFHFLSVHSVTIVFLVQENFKLNTLSLDVSFFVDVEYICIFHVQRSILNY